MQQKVSVDRVADEATSVHIRTFLETPGKSFFLLWIPVLFSMVAEPLTGLVDTAFVARLGVEALAALGVGTVVLSSGLWLFNFLSVGSQTEVAQALGRKELWQGRKIASLTIVLALGIGICISLLLYLFASQVASLLGATASIHQYAVTYIQIRAFGGPAVLVTITSFGLLYGLGDMRTPLGVAVGVNVMNIGLDALLIFGVGPFPALGIAGAALASSLSQVFGAIVCGYVVFKKLGFTTDIELHHLTKMLKIGRDMLFRTGSLILFLLLATRLATQLGPESGAAHQAIRQVWVFTGFFLDATAVVAQSTIGFYVGCQKVVEARKVAWLVCGWSFFIGVLLMAAMIAGKDWVAMVLLPEGGASRFPMAWIIAAFFQPVAAIAFVTDGIHWGTGDFKYLRNVVIMATLCASFCLAVVEILQLDSLAVIWWITGGWLVIRALFGILRVWPGSPRSPLYVINKS
jgi:MATE family multidrug resistance protein